MRRIRENDGMWKSLSLLTPAVTLVLLTSLYAMSYYTLVSVEHSESTGEADAAYPAFVEPLSISLRPMESVDRLVRADLWSPEVVFDQPVWIW